MHKILSTIIEILNKITSVGGKAPRHIISFIRFSLSSSTTLLIDLFLLGVLVEFFHVYYLTAAAISFTSSNSINYIISRFWGFKETQRRLARGYFIFITIGTFGLILTVYLMWIFVDILNVFYFLARIMVAIIEGTISFVLHYFLTFRMHKPPEFSKKEFSRLFNVGSGR